MHHLIAGHRMESPSIKCALRGIVKLMIQMPTSEHFNFITLTCFLHHIDLIHLQYLHRVPNKWFLVVLKKTHTILFSDLAAAISGRSSELPKNTVEELSNMMTIVLKVGMSVVTFRNLQNLIVFKSIAHFLIVCGYQRWNEAAGSILDSILSHV